MKRAFFTLIMFLAGIWVLEAQNTCIAPSGLTASPHTPNTGNVTLNWEAPQCPNQQILSWATPAAASSPDGWGNGTNGAAVVRFTTTDLQPYSGYVLTSVSFIPAIPSYLCTYTIRIWESGSVNETTSTITPGSLVHEQAVTQSLTVNTQNVVELSREYNINPSREIWIGISCQLATSGMPIYVGTNTVVPFKNLWLNNITESWEVQTTANYSIFGILEKSDCIPSSYNVYRDGILLTSSSNTQHAYVDNPQLSGTYEYGVTSVYTNGCESQPVTLSVQLGDPCMLSSLPYWQNFDGYVGNTATTVASHVLPECWSYLNEGTANPGLPSTYASESYAQSGMNSIRFNVGTGSTDGNQYAILPKLDNVAFSPNMLRMEFDAQSSSATNPFNLSVGVMSDPADPTTFQQVASYPISGTDYSTIRVDFGNFSGNGDYVALKAPKGNVANTGYVDNVMLGDNHLLPKPDSVVAYQTTTSSVSLSWRENGSANSWIIEYGPKGFTPGMGTMTDANATHTVISSLTAGTDYDFYVRALGVAYDTSAYSWVCQVQTLCNILTSLPFMEDFDTWPATTLSNTTNNLPNCWNYINPGTNWTGYPVIFCSSNYAYSGWNSLRFYSTSANTCADQYAILPRIDTSVYPINTLELKFKIKKVPSFNCILNVGVMTDPTNAATFVSVATVQSTTENTFLNKTVSFANYTGSGEYIAIKLAQPSGTTNTAYVDNIQLDVRSSCVSPSSVQVTGITESSATIRWTPAGSESFWDVVVVPAGDNPSSGAIMTCSTTEYEYTNLTPSTDYCAYVRADCGSTQSQWTYMIRFTTRCNAITTLPYVETFDAYGTATTSTVSAPGPFPTCWTRKSDFTNPYPYISSTYKYNGVGSLYMVNGSISCYSLAVSEPFDLSYYNGTDVTLSFKALRAGSTSGYGRVNVGIMTDPDDMSTFVSLKNLFASDYPTSGTWYEHIVKLPYTNRTFYLAFYLPASENSMTYIDDIKLDVAPTCLEPSGLRVSEVTGSTAKISWTLAPYGVRDYVVEYAVSGSNNWSSPQTVTGASCRLSELQPSTRYDVRVYSDCQYSTGTPLEISFATGCAVPRSVEIGTGTTNSAFVPAYNTYKYSYSQQIYLASEMGGAQDISSISFQYAGTSSAKRNLTIYLMHTSATSIASWLPINNAQKVFDGTVVWQPNSEDSGWNTLLLDSVFHYNGTSNLVLIVDNNSMETGGTAAKNFKTHTSTSNITRYVNTTSLASVDNFNPYNLLVAGTGSAERNNIRFTSCNAATCVPPVAWFDNVSSTSVTIDFSPGNGETEWLLEYRVSGSSNWTSVGNITIHPYSLGNLTPNTNYQFRLSSVCGSESSLSKTILNTHTPCTEITIPYFDNFETYGTPSSSTSVATPGLFPPCWTALSNMSTPYPYIYSGQHYSGAGCLYMNGTSSNYCYAIMPPMEASVKMDSLQIKFYARKSSNSYYVEVGIMSDPADRSTFERVGICYPSVKDNWELIEMYTTSYVGTGRYIAFRTPLSLSSVMYLDDIDVKYRQSCTSVENIHSLEIHHNEATITWSPRGMEGNWNYVYGLKDSVDLNNASINTTTNTTATLTNLMSYTDYDVFIQADCGSNSTSDWVKYSFSTTCSPISSLPYIENFDSYTSAGSAYLTDCWTRLTNETNLFPYYGPYRSNNISCASVPNAIYFSNSTATAGGYSMAILQEMDPSLALNTLQVTFKTYTQTGSSYVNSNMTVGVISNPSDANTFVPIATFQNPSGGTWFPHTASLASYSGNGRHIAFKSQGQQILLDDVFIDLISNCTAPGNVTVSQTGAHDATVTWTTSSSSSAYELYPVPYGHNIAVSDVTPMVVTSSPCTLTGLTAGTHYTLYIRSVCANNAGYSNFVQVPFHTECEPINQMPWQENFDAEDGVTSTSSPNNLPLCWDYINEGGATSTSYDGFPLVYRSSSLSQSAPNALYFNRGTSTNYYADQYAILPEIDTTLFPLQILELSFDARKGSQSYPTSMLIVGVILDTSNFLTFRPVDTVYVAETTYDHYTVFLNKYQQTEGRRIAIAAKLLPAGYNAAYVDNIKIDVSSVCLPVNRPVLTQAAPHSLTVQWGVNGSESDWKIQYKAVSDSVWESEDVSINPSTITGLQANTEYEIRVVAVCGSDDYSIPSQVLVASTDCEPLDSLPYAVNFDNYTHTSTPTTGSSNVPTCWHALNSGTSYSNYPYVVCDNLDDPHAQSGRYSLHFWVGTAGTYNTQYAVLPEVDPTVAIVSGLELSFDVRAYAVYSSVPTFTCLIGVMSDYLDESTFEMVDSLVINTEAYQHYRIFFNNYTGNGRFLTIKVPKLTYTNQGCFDNIMISQAQTCLPVDNVTASNVTNQSAVLTWHPNGTETAWNIRYRPVGDTVWSTSSATSTTATLTGLTSNTIYEVQVQAACNSDWSASILFETECNDGVQLPYIENFDNVTGTTDRNVNVLPDCWRYINTG
nr:fibronectin type III domain-containing protein [Bacteroidales bacterium]